MTALSVPREPADLLSRAARNLTGRDGVALVFGGLGDSTVPVTVAAGTRTAALTSMVIRPTRGLGGQALAQRRALAVAEYDRAPGITHDYDEPVLGEGIVGLAVAPLMSGSRVCGLLYAATRTRAALTPDFLLRLTSEAQAVSLEVSVRDERERGPAADSGALRELAQRTEALRELARTTRDPATRAALLELLGTRPEPEAPRTARRPEVPPTARRREVPLTARQREVLELAELGLRNAEIGTRLRLSEQTVKGYMRALMARLDARTRQEAIHKYRSYAPRA